MNGNQGNILLESGTNELEIVLFGIGDGTFAINVLKVREIIVPMPITKIPNSHEFVEGVIQLRGEVIPVIDLARVLNIPPSADGENDKFIVSELNEIKIAFRVHNIFQIQRVSWQQIEKPHDLSAGRQPYATGIIKLGDRMSILLDLEKIVVEINPDLGGDVDSLKVLGERERTLKKIVAAEDSAVLRQLLKDTLSEAGYENVAFFQNGQEAWEYLEMIAEDESLDPKEQVQLVLTDIEMPRMDGHHLTYRIKQHDRLKDIPVIIFSSLITEELYHKGESVGATSQVSKPKIVDLVKEIDKYIL